MDLEQKRRAYAEEVGAAAEVRNRAIAEAFAHVRREDFLGPGPWELVSIGEDLKPRYERTPDADPARILVNAPVAIDAARMLNNGQPQTLALWMDALELRPGEAVLHLGCGLGYYTAILAEVVGPAGRVVALEIDRELAARARANLARWPQVSVEERLSGRFDAILINAGVTHPLPEWLDALKPGGRMAVPITAPLMPGLSGMGVMLRVDADGAARFVSPVGIFEAEGIRDPSLEAEIRDGFMSNRLAEVTRVRRDRHPREASCVVHREDVCLSSHKE